MAGEGRREEAEGVAEGVIEGVAICGQREW